MHRDVDCRTGPLSGSADGSRERKKDAELRRRSNSKVEGLAGSFESDTCSGGKRQDASRTGRERMLPCAPKEERISTWRGRRSVTTMVVQLHFSGFMRGFGKEARDGCSCGGFRQNVRDKRAALMSWFRADGPNMRLESQNGVRVRSRTGRGAGLPASRWIRGESHAARGLGVVARGIAGSVGVRDNADSGVGS